MLVALVLVAMVLIALVLVALVLIALVLKALVLIALVLIVQVRVHSPKISTGREKIAQIYLPDLPLFASLIMSHQRHRPCFKRKLFQASQTTSC